MPKARDNKLKKRRITQKNARTRKGINPPEKIRPHETPAQRRTRLLKDRRLAVTTISNYTFVPHFSKRLTRVPVKNGGITYRIQWAAHDSKGFESIRSVFVLKYRGERLARLTLQTRVRDGKREVEIEGHQGISRDVKLFEKFEKDNGQPWNVFLANAVLRTAHEGQDYSADRVLLRDITTDLSYIRPLNIHGKKIIEMQQIMKSLYLKTKRACSFTGKDQIGLHTYWVREFP